MAKVYVVQRGDYASSIAADHGFEGFNAIWSAPENADLRALRKDPQQLVPGDEVTIPDRTPAQFRRHTGRTHTFVLDRDALVLRLRVHDHRRRALASAPGELRVDGEVLPVTTDATGLVEVPIPRGAHAATLVVGDHSFDLAIGDLQPVSEAAGQWGRFVNLDAWFDEDDEDEDGHTDARELAFELAAAFRAKASDGQAAPPALKELEEAHDS